MILKRYYVFLPVLTVASIFTGCTLQKMVKMAKQQNLTVTPSPLEVHGDSVRFTVAAELPVKMLKKNKIYAVKPFYQYGNEKIELEAVEFNSKDFPQAKTQQPKLSHTFSFFYKPEIGNGDLKAIGTASNLTKSKSKSTEPLPLTTGIIRTSRLVKEISEPAFADHGYNNKEELIPVNVDFFFDQGSSKLRTSSVNTSGKELDAFIAKKNATRTVTIIGQHSPEGTETVNAELAEERATAIADYYKKAMKKYDYKGQADSIKFVTKGVVLDWEPLRRLFTTDNTLSDAQEGQILSIINGAGSFEEKEKEIQKLGFYKQLLNDVYPKLRVAKTEILTVKPKKSDAEISILAKNITDGSVKEDTLNEAELGYAATLTANLDEKEKIYLALIKKSDSWIAHNNLGAVYILKAKKELESGQKASLAEKALNHFQMAQKKQDNAIPQANIAAAYALQGKRAESRVALESALQKGPDQETSKSINAMKGALEIRDGQYAQAVQSLSKAKESYEVLFDLALANLLKGDVNAANNGFQAAINANPQGGDLAYYGAAIVAARQSNEGNITNNLKKAVSINKSLGEKAVNDLEFRNYWNSENFKASVK
jgi:tetratricopeptide (TPR) repeat protein